MQLFYVSLYVIHRVIKWEKTNVLKLVFQKHKSQNLDRTESDLWSLGLSEILISEDSLAVLRREKSQYKEHI